MDGTFDARDFQGRLQRLDDLLHEVQRFADPEAQAHTREIVQALLDLQGLALERILDHLNGSGTGVAEAREACNQDEVVGGLLLLHGLHPLDLKTRVNQAIEQVQPALQSHGGSVSLVEISTEGVIRLRLEGNCQGCPSSAVTMKQTIEEAILARAPDASGLEVEGVVEEPTTPDGQPLIAISMP